MSDAAADDGDSSQRESSVEQRFSRYERQWRYAPIGLAGQQRLRQSRVLLIGCGALGSVAAELLVRAGVGSLRIVDRDFLEWNNLQRQSLYTEEDVRRGWPKAVTAAERPAAINHEVSIEPIVADATWERIGPWFEGVDVVIDGTDNFETRFLINDASCQTGIPWVFAGCLGAEGQSMTIVPGVTPCLRCLMPDGPPAAGESPTCDSAGILGTIIHVMASIQVTEALKWIVGDRDAIQPRLCVIDLWTSGLRSLDLGKLPREACPTCAGGERLWLSGERASQSVVLCGRNSVQVSLPTAPDLDTLPSRIASARVLVSNAFLVRLRVEDHELTVFRDGRVIVSGETDPAAARSLVARHLGM